MKEASAFSPVFVIYANTVQAKTQNKFTALSLSAFSTHTPLAAPHVYFNKNFYSTFVVNDIVFENKIKLLSDIQ